MVALSLSLSSSQALPSKVAAASMTRASEVSVGQASAKMPTVVGCRHATIGERVAAFLSRRHPLKTAVSVWSETGIPEDTVEKVLERCSAPSTKNFLLMLEAYGPAFVTACLPNPPAWLSEAAHHARVAEARAAVAKAQADLERAVLAVRA